jgi:hypothetical protein
VRDIHNPKHIMEEIFPVTPARRGIAGKSTTAALSLPNKQNVSNTNFFFTIKFILSSRTLVPSKYWIAATQVTIPKPHEPDEFFQETELLFHAPNRALDPMRRESVFQADLTLPTLKRRTRAKRRSPKQISKKQHTYKYRFIIKMILTTLTHWHRLGF